MQFIRYKSLFLFAGLVILGGFFVQNSKAQTTKPDLTIAEVFFERQNPVRIGSPDQGERVRVAVNVENLGADLTSDQGILNWSVAVQDFDWESSPAISSSITFDGTNPLRTGVITQLEGWGRFTSSGNKVATFIVDAANELSEENETNNTYSLSMQVADANSVFYGDGTYELEIGDKVQLDNGSMIELVDINSSNFPKLQYAKPGNVEIKETGYINTSLQSTLSLSDYGIKVHFDVVGFKLPGGSMPYTQVTVESIDVTEVKPDLVVTEVGIKYFYNSGNAGNYYYAVVENKGGSYTFTSSNISDNSLVVRFDGQPGWVGASNALSYLEKKDYSQGSVIESGQKIELMGPSTNQAYTGTYSIKATVDPNNFIAELNENNNSLNKTLSVGAPFEIHNIQHSSITSKSARITWQTSKPTDSFVYYRETGSDSPSWQGNESLQTHHSVVIPDLKPATTYFYYINTKDAEGNIIRSDESWFETKSADSLSGNITGGGYKVNGRIATIQWRTDGRYNCSVVFKGRSDIGDDLIYPGAGIAISHAGEDTSVSVDLSQLKLPNRESDRVVYYRIICRDRSTGVKVAQSNIEKLEYTPVASTGTAPAAGTTVVQNDPEAAESSEVNSLRERIKRLELKITELERQVVEAEKRLTKTINAALAHRVRGEIFLQVQEHGEAWYVDPITEQRFYLKDGESAYRALQAFGLGISDANLRKIPVGLEERADKTDSDGDGLDDRLEEAIGTDKNKTDTDGDGFNDGEEVKSAFNPVGAGNVTTDASIANSLDGRIVIQVQNRGQAWYIHDGKRYYLKDGDLAYQIMRFLSSGITNSDLRQIGVGALE